MTRRKLRDVGKSKIIKRVQNGKGFSEKKEKDIITRFNFTLSVH